MTDAADALESHLHHQVDHLDRYFWHRLRWRVIAGRLPRDRPFTLIDVGAGTGMTGDYLTRDRPSGVYRFVEPIGSLQSALEARFGAAANAAAEHDYSGADFVCLLDVLEHQADDEEFLARLVEKMDRGATLTLTVPAMRSLWSGWDELLGHHRRYRRKDLLALARPLPLDVVEVSYLFPEMYPVALARRFRLNRKVTPLQSEDAQFPELPRWLNQTLYWIGCASLPLRRVTPIGTSLLLVARRTDGRP